MLKLSNRIKAHLESDGITAIEWAERAKEILPPGMLHISIEMGKSETSRLITVWQEE